MKVGIIIVTYNSQKDIGRLLDSIIIQNYKNMVVYIVDSNSTDQTLNIARSYQSKTSMHIISSRINHGFARGNNIGIQRAMEEGCDLVFILNPDIQLEEKCIDIMVKRIESDEKIGVIGPIVLYGNEPDNIIQAYGVNANFRTQKKVGPFSNEKWTINLPAEIYVDFVLGGAMMVRSSVLKITGLGEVRLSSFIKDKVESSKFSNIICYGFHSQPSEILADTSVFVSIQSTNNYPSQSVLEAMGCGNAIIATDVGDTRMFINQENGLLISLDVVELANAIETLYLDRELRNKLGNYAYSYVREYHTVEKMADFIM